MRETDVSDWYIELYENFPVDRKEQLNNREREIIREIATLNKNVEGRTRKECREANKDKIKEHRLEYYEDNKKNVTGK